MGTERRSNQISHLLLRTADYLNGLTPSTRAARKREMEQRIVERAATQETYNRRLGRMRKLYQHLEEPEVISRLTGFYIGSDIWGYEIPHLGRVVINIPGSKSDGDQSQYIQQIGIEKADGSEARFNYRKLFEEGDDLKVAEEELAGAELLVGLTDISLRLLRVFHQEPFRSKGPRGVVDFTPNKVTGEVNGKKYEIGFLDTRDVTTRWVGDLVPDMIIFGSIVIYLGKVGYVIQHKKDLKLKMVSKIDLLARERNSGNDVLNDRFVPDDLDRLSSVLDAAPNSQVSRWVYVKPGAIEIYRGEEISPDDMGKVEYREIRKQRRHLQA